MSFKQLGGYCAIVCAGVALALGLFFLRTYLEMKPFLDGSDEESRKADKGHPSDATMKMNFLAHEADFEALRKLFQSGAQKSGVWVRIGQGQDFSDTPVADLNKYLVLFRKLGIEEGTASKGEPVDLTVSSWGFMLAGSSHKGYIYSTVKPIDVRQEHESRIYHPLKGNWYILEETTD